jgi:hypothetical protein
MGENLGNSGARSCTTHLRILFISVAYGGDQIATMMLVDLPAVGCITFRRFGRIWQGAISWSRPAPCAVTALGEHLTRCSR